MSLGIYLNIHFKFDRAYKNQRSGHIKIASTLLFHNSEITTQIFYHMHMQNLMENLLKLTEC